MRVYPFRPYQYSATAGDWSNLVTQPYDKIYPEMRERYLSLSPYNLVRLILGERFASDNEQNNVYIRSQLTMKEWINDGILTQESAPAYFAYFQDFTDPDSGQPLTRKGFIGLGAVEPYSRGIVFRHEQTLTGPKQDRLELLKKTRMFFEQLFMLYPDPEGKIDDILDKAATGTPQAVVHDEYGPVHRLWKITDPEQIEAITGLMEDKKIIIADGHHRYETAVAFHEQNPQLAGADRITMTFVNMHSKGLRILATHRVVDGLADYDAAATLAKLGQAFRVTELASGDDLKGAWAEPHESLLRVGVKTGGKLALIEAPRGPKDLDVRFLHDRILNPILGITPEAVRQERFIHYVRGLDKALAGNAQAAFLLEPTTIEQVADVSFSGGVMPQKSTDFYPKLLSGLTIYKLGE